MARIRNGILGGFSNKVGEVIGQNYAGVSTMRAMPKYVTNPQTLPQQQHRAKVKMLGDFLRPLAKVTNLSTWGGNSVYNSYNKAFRANFPNIAIKNGAPYFVSLDDIKLGEYWGEPFPDIVATFKFLVDKPLCSVHIEWDTTQFSPFCIDTDRPILFILQELPGGVYSFVFADLLDCQRSDGEYDFQVDFPLSTTIGGKFYYTFGFTIYPYPVEEQTPNLKAINWDDYYNKLRDRYLNSGGRISGRGDDRLWGQYNTITIPAHNIPAFKPAKSFVDEVRG
jgi:hypothetical protein